MLFCKRYMVLYMLFCIYDAASTNTAYFFGPFLGKNLWPAQSDSVVLQHTSDLQLVNAGA
jgi:hypothetical protein